jgi:CRP-like cAMP-binding protein
MSAVPKKIDAVTQAASSPELIRMLHEAAWAQGLTAEQLHRVERTTFERSFRAGCVLCHKGAPSSHWLGVIDGLVKLQTVTHDGRSTTFIGVTTGGWLGEGAVLKHEPRPYEVVALQSSRIAYMPAETFEWLVGSSLSFCRYLIEQLNARLGQFVALVEHQRMHDDADCIVAGAIAELFNPRFAKPTSPDLQISQEEVGRLSGLSRQMVGRALHRLGQAGVLQVRYKTIHVIDMERLRREAQAH